MYVERTIAAYLARASEQFRVLIVTGPRQVGKTTCLQHAAGPERAYVTLDDPQARELAVEEPGLFLQRFSPPLLIDEIQYAPGLLPLIKMAVDQDKRPGRYWLTGSQQFHLMRNVSESLAGRVGIFQMLGFSSREIDGKSELAHPFLPGTPLPADEISGHVKPLALMPLYTRIWRGCFPEYCTDPRQDRDVFFRSYGQTYLQRDVRALANVGDELAFLKFLRAVAGRTGQLLNLADLARDVDIAPNTAKKWLSILRTSGLVYLLEPWHSNLTKRMVKAPKLYFLDTGLAAALTGWSSPETLEVGAMGGAIFETWAVAEIIKSFWHAGKEAPLTYYRDRDQKEIDLLIDHDGMLLPVEIKKTASPTKKDIRHFDVLKRLNKPIGPGCVLCMSDKAIPISRDVDAVPVSWI